MSERIYKFPFMVADRFILHMPRQARVLTVQMHYEIPCLWALVNSESPLTIRRFRIFGAGHAMPENPEWCSDYIGTFQQADGALVWHLFEEK